nr:MAG TPA: hypothetical protein [Inoviridae sp.]
MNNDSLSDSLRLASSCKQSLNSKIQGSTRLNINVAFRFPRRRNKNQKTIAQMSIYFYYAANSLNLKEIIMNKREESRKITS